MEKDRSTKIVSIVALVVAVVCLSIGFAAFSKQLTLTPEAVVSGAGAENFVVKFSNTNLSQTEGKVTGSTTGSEGVTAEEAILTETTITNLKAKFTQGGQTVTYKFYVHNAGAMDAYLTGVEFSKPNPTCTLTADGNQDLVDSACEKLKVTINAGGEDYTSTNNAIQGKTLSKDSYAEVTVKIEYQEGASAVDGAFDVDFGSITLNYRSRDTQ